MTTYRVVGLDLPVQQPVLLYPGVAVDRPDESERVPAALVLLVAEHGGRGTSVDLDVTSANEVLK